MPPPIPGASASQSELRNFSFPILKTWGAGQRKLRCLSVNRDGATIRDPTLDPEATTTAHPEPQEPGPEPEPEPESEPEPEPTPEPAPRKRRRRRGLAPPIEWRAPLAYPRTVRLRSEDAEEPRPRFSITLSRLEIAEDIYSLTGSLPRARPRKRPRPLQKQLDSLFPGSWLSEVTANSYKVPD